MSSVINAFESDEIELDKAIGVMPTDEEKTVNGIRFTPMVYMGRRETLIMNDYIAYCGLDCETCEARLATVNNDRNVLYFP